MELGDAGLNEQPFRADGQPSAICSFAAHRAALQFLKNTYDHRHGLGILQGPTLSGKTTILKQFQRSLHGDVSKAYVFSKRQTPLTLLRSILEQFGYELELDSQNELLGMLRVFAMQQATSGYPPSIIIDDCQHLDDASVRLLCDLADIKANRQSALRIFMACDRNVEALINRPELQCIAARVTGIHRLQPMALREARDYIYEKLYAAGSAEPATIFPQPVCVDMHMAGGGWPGIMDRLALFAIARATQLPITTDLVERRQLPEDMRNAASQTSADDGDIRRPKLFVSRGGDLLKEIELDRSRLLIGRSGHNDLSFDNKSVSRHHALLVCHGESTLLMDLNSTNGTYVNSRRISNHVLRHDDIISLGPFRLKFVFPAAERQFELEEAGFAETVIMKTLEDMRHMLSGESTQTLPIDALRRLAGD